MKISVKLFLTFLAVSGFIILANQTLARWSFHQGLLEFVAGMEQQRMSDLAERFSIEYEFSGESWQGFGEQDFEQVLNEHASSPGPRRQRVPRHRSGAEHRPGKHRPPPPKDRRSSKYADARKQKQGPPTALFGEKGEFIAGFDGFSKLDQSITVPILYEGFQVGSLKSWPTINDSSPLASQFSRQQLYTSIVIAVLCLLIAVVISWLTSQRLLRPVKSVLAGVGELTKGNFNVNYQQNRKDELGQLMVNIEALSNQLEKNRTSKNRFFADVSHELRTPLSILIGEIDLLKAGLRSFDDKQLASFEQEIRRLNYLVDDVYQLSLSDIGGLKYQFSRQNINGSILAVLTKVQDKATAKNISIDCQINEEVWASIDKKRFEQLLLNLLNNSLAYTDSPGQIVIALEAFAAKLLLTIEDSSPGVDEAECQQLFEPLYRQDRSRKRRESGAGLGLTLCKSIVEAHGGKITISPSNLGGLRVTILLDTL